MKEQQKAEALERMNILNMSKQCISAFKSGKVWESEGPGSLYEVNENEQKIINAFEAEHNALVYHMIHNVYREIGECYAILYVSDSPEEWEDDKTDLRDGYAFVYVKNMEDDFCSEFGSIGVKPSIGGLVRTM